MAGATVGAPGAVAGATVGAPDALGARRRGGGDDLAELPRERLGADGPGAAVPGHRSLPPGEIVWAIDARRGQQLIWQAQTGFSFRLAGGFFGGVPTGTPDAVMQELLAVGEVSGASKAQLQAFMARHRVGAVLVADDEPPWIRRQIAQAAGVHGIRQGGADLFRLGRPFQPRSASRPRNLPKTRPRK